MDILYTLLGLGVIIVVGYFVLKAQQQKKREEQQVLAMQWKAENKVRMSDPILRSDIEILTLTDSPWLDEAIELRRTQIARRGKRSG